MVRASGNQRSPARARLSAPRPTKSKFLAILPLLCFTCLQVSAATGYTITNAFRNLTFTAPVCITSVPDETNRLFIVERKGGIAVITNLAAPSAVTGFMPLSVLNSTEEEGLLGLVFHPGFATNGFFYVAYTGSATTSAGTGRHNILSRFRVSDSNPNKGDPASEVRYVVQYDRAPNHNGGDLHFGPDGYLYASLGDEGGAYGQFANTQKIDLNFFSAIMRIDVDKRPGSLLPNSHPSSLPSPTNYSIPSDNYFVGATNFNGSPVDPAKVRTEFWAVGMRNPWRFSFDPITGVCYVGHVGQINLEWINIVTNGANCGWNYYEGSKQWTNPLPAGFVFTPPLVEHGRTNFACIIGGVVYRGPRIPQLTGAYIYGDYLSGEVRALRHSGMNVTENSLLLKSLNARFTAFGIDPSNGDILAANSTTIQRLIYTNKVSLVITQVVQFETNLLLSGIGGAPSQSYYLLAASNLNSGVLWSLIATGSFDSTGTFSITTPLESTTSQKFFRVQSP